MTDVELRIPGDLQTRLMTDLAGPREWAGYLLCGVSRLSNCELLLGKEWVPVPSKYQIPNSGHGFSWHPDFDVQMLNRIRNENLSSVVLHYHGGSSPNLGPGSDLATARSLMPFLSSEVPGRAHVFGVLGDHAGSGLVFRDGKETGHLERLVISSSWLDTWKVNQKKQMQSITLRQDRLVRGFGSSAFENLSKSRVGVVGCGGGGSHLIQQLAYLGVGSLILVDDDLVEETNLNRLIGAMPKRLHRSLIDRVLRRGIGDVGRLKVDVMRRLIESVDDTIDIQVFASRFPTRDTIEALRGCDIVIACVDRLQVRDDLNRLCKRYLIPLIDIGIEITPGTSGSQSVKAIPGRITKVLADGPCLRCQGVISDANLAAERDGKPLGYTGAARIPDPAVVTLNGIIASMAATEVLQLLTGFADKDAPNCGWMYDGKRGTIERVEKSFRGCNACNTERSRGDT